MKKVRLTTRRMTLECEVDDDGTITSVETIAMNVVNEKLRFMICWLKNFGGFKMEIIKTKEQYRQEAEEAAAAKANE
jgi:hypothetical protein